MADVNRGEPAKHYPRSFFNDTTFEPESLYRLIHGQTDLETPQSLAYFDTTPQVGDEVWLKIQMVAGQNVFVITEIGDNFHELYAQKFRQIQLRYDRTEY